MHLLHDASTFFWYFVFVVVQACDAQSLQLPVHVTQSCTVSIQFPAVLEVAVPSLYPFAVLQAVHFITFINCEVDEPLYLYVVEYFVHSVKLDEIVPTILLEAGVPEYEVQSCAEFASRQIKNVNKE